MIIQEIKEAIASEWAETLAILAGGAGIVAIVYLIFLFFCCFKGG